MAHPAFVHLRLHGEYSIADGTVRIDDAVRAAADDAMPALALTDLANLFGLVKFYTAARGAGVKPIAGCDVGQALLQGNAAAARAAADAWKRRFPGRAYLEVQRAGHADDDALVDAAVALGARVGLPIVATHPVQFLRPEDFRAHEARVCIAEGHVLSDARRPRAFTNDQYFLTQGEMARRFADLPEALENSVAIARRCNLTIPLGKPHLPAFPTPPGVTIEEHLEREVAEGLERRLAKLYRDDAERDRARPAYVERLAFETRTIVQMGFAGYFLIVADFIGWAK